MAPSIEDSGAMQPETAYIASYKTDLRARKNYFIRSRISI